MRYEKWLALKKLLKGVKAIHFQSIATFLVNECGVKSESVATIVSRAEKRGILWRLCKGWYAFVDNLPAPDDIDEIAMTIVRPSYVSMERALSVQGILSQGIFVVTLITPVAWNLKRDFVIRLPEREYLIELKKARKIPEELAEKQVASGKLAASNLPQVASGKLVGEIADPERALADLVYYRGRVEQKWEYLVQVLSDIYWDEVNVERVIEILKSSYGLESPVQYLEKHLPEEIRDRFLTKERDSSRQFKRHRSCRART